MNAKLKMKSLTETHLQTAPQQASALSERLLTREGFFSEGNDLFFAETQSIQSSSKCIA